MKGSRPLTTSEVRKILAAFDRPGQRWEWAARNRCLFVLGITCGFRIAAILSLTRGDVVSPAGQIAGTVSIARKHQKGRREGMTKPVNGRLRQALEQWLAAQEALGYARADTPLFLSSRAGRTTGGRDNQRKRAIGREQAWRIINAAARAAGLSGRIGTHSMRKTSGMLIYAATGKDIRAAQAHLGHADIGSTGDYLDPDEEAVTEAIEKMEI